MNYNKLEKNIMDILLEEQIKLGYRSEKVRLYYPLRSLERLLDVQADSSEMLEYLVDFCEHMKQNYGKIKVSEEKGRFCFALPPQSSDYVHGHAGDNMFIVELINIIRKHGTTIEKVLEIFYKYSEHVYVEKVEHGEFDYVVYFEDGKPDDFVYCLTVEECHIIYHRFTKEDYQDFDFE